VKKQYINNFSALERDIFPFKMVKLNLSFWNGEILISPFSVGKRCIYFYIFFIWAIFQKQFKNENDRKTRSHRAAHL
jgi:hypothetical protein